MRSINAAFLAAVLTIPLTTSQAQSATVADQPLPDTPGTAASTKADEVTLRKLPLRFLTDEVAIVTSPARIRKHDLIWLLPLAGATATAFATDTYTMRHVVSRNPSFNDAAGTSSDILRDAAIGIPVVLFAAGQVRSDAKTREAGLLAGEAMLDAVVFDEAIKYVTLRERPAKDNANGTFFTGNAASDPSFISGHSIIAWSSAAVLAEEYNKPWQQVGIYTLASGVSLTRVLGQQHFPSDSLLGSAAGWLIGHYVYQKHHRDFVDRQARAKAVTPNETALLFRP